MEYSFTHNQCLAFAKILIEIMSADGEISEDEWNLYAEIADAFGLSKGDYLIASSLNLLDCLTELKNMPLKEKETIGVFMMGIVNADGIASKEEMDLLIKVSDLTDIPLP